MDPNTLFVPYLEKITDPVLKEACEKLLNEKAFKEAVCKHLKDPVVQLMVSTTLPIFANLLNYYNESKEAELSVTLGAYQLGTLVKEPVGEMLHEFRKSKGSLVLTEGCPFMKVGDQFCISSSSSNEEVWLPLDNLEIQAAYAMVYPLSQNKIKDYNTFKPLETLVSSFWWGVSGQLMGSLLPPFHSLLLFRLVHNNKYLWAVFDCGKQGVGLSAAEEPLSREVPFKELLKDNYSNAKVVFQDLNPTFMGRPLRLYDMLQYGLERATPINLKWFLNHHKDNVIEAITQFCNTTCWEFTNGALRLFTDFQITEELVSDSAIKCQP